MCVLWGLTGCATTYEFVPPTTEAGRLCVTQCAAVRESCVANAQAQANREFERCERASDQEFSRCLILADTKEKKAACDKRRRYCGESGAAALPQLRCLGEDGHDQGLLTGDAATRRKHYLRRGCRH